MEKLFARVAVGAVLILALVGCGQQSTKNAQSSSAVKTQKKAKSSHKSVKVSHRKAHVVAAGAKASGSESASSQSSSASSSQAAQSSSSSSSSSNSSPREQVDDKTAGIMLCMFQRPDALPKDGQEHLWYGTAGTDSGSIPANYKYISAHGDPLSVIFYTVSGDTITYKYVDDSHSDCVADAPTVTKTVSLTRLENDYYQTQDQKNQVAGFAGKLIDE